MHHMDTNLKYGENAWWQLHKNAARRREQVLKAIPHKTAAVWSPTPHHKKLSKSDEPDMQDTAGEIRTNS